MTEKIDFKNDEIIVIVQRLIEKFPEIRKFTLGTTDINLKGNNLTIDLKLIGKFNE